MILSVFYLYIESESFGCLFDLKQWRHFSTDVHLILHKSPEKCMNTEKPGPRPV